MTLKINVMFTLTCTHYKIIVINQNTRWLLSGGSCAEVSLKPPWVIVIKEKLTHPFLHCLSGPIFLGWKQDKVGTWESMTPEPNDHRAVISQLSSQFAQKPSQMYSVLRLLCTLQQPYLPPRNWGATAKKMWISAWWPWSQIDQINESLPVGKTEKGQQVPSKLHIFLPFFPILSK